MPTHLDSSDPEMLKQWQPAIRAQIIDGESFSRIGFKREGEKFWVCHLEPDEAENLYFQQPLMSFVRPTEAVFKDQMVYLRNYADLRPDRASEILVQIGSANAYLGSIAFIRFDRTPYTMELLLAVFRLCQYVEMRVKAEMACRRPVEYSPQVQPIIATPGHGALPSGHATESHALATVLSALLQDSGNNVYSESGMQLQLYRLASRISVNRTVAGLHFPVDSIAGSILGLTLGQYFVQRCLPLSDEERKHAEKPGNPRALRTYRVHNFDGTAYVEIGDKPTTPDFYTHAILDFPNADENRVSALDVCYSKGSDAGVTEESRQNMNVGATSLSWLWEQARKEWV